MTGFALDPTDLRLLDLLQHDASLSNQDLAAAAHVSPATCLRRVRRLVEAGVIERRVALLSHERLGPIICAKPFHQYCLLVRIFKDSKIQCDFYTNICIYK